MRFMNKRFRRRRQSKNQQVVIIAASDARVFVAVAVTRVHVLRTAQTFSRR
jgi:hypothetical protein